MTASGSTSSKPLPPAWPLALLAELNLIAWLIETVVRRDGWDWLSLWLDPQNYSDSVVSALGLISSIYWYFWIFATHRAVKSVDASYRVGPVKALLLSALPPVLILLLISLIPPGSSKYVAISVLGCSIILTIIYVWWQMRWTFILLKWTQKETESKSRIPNWLPGILLLACTSFEGLLQRPLRLMALSFICLFLANRTSQALSAISADKGALSENLVKSFGRWLLVLPIALIGWGLGTGAQVVSFYLGKLGSSVNPIFHVLNFFGWIPFDWLSSYWLVEFGSKTAPKHKVAVAIVLLGLVIAEHALMFVVKAFAGAYVQGPNYSYVHLAFASAGGIAAAGYAVYKTRRATTHQGQDNGSQ